MKDILVGNCILYFTFERFIYSSCLLKYSSDICFGEIKIVLFNNTAHITFPHQLSIQYMLCMYIYDNNAMVLVILSVN